VGITYVHEVAEKTGATAADVARGFVAVRDAFGMPELWAAIEALDGRVPAEEQAKMLAEAGRLHERATVWFLREEQRPLDVAAVGKAYRAEVEEACRILPQIVTGAARADLERRAAALRGKGVPEALALRAAGLPLQSATLDVVRLARQAQQPVGQVAHAYFAVGERFGFDWLRQAATALPAESAWDKQAVTAVVDDLYAHQGGLTRSVLAAASASAAPADALGGWIQARRPQVARADQLLSELQATGAPTLAMLAVANRALKSLAS
jgi:glutamate dehydrogenase